MAEISERIVVCDSGLGGLDVAARFFRHCDESPCDVIYVNAYPDRDWGYNDLATEREQEELFKRVLEGMERWSPSRCLIACNTLSIIWKRLSHWWTPPFPVCGIIEAAVSQMAGYMRANEDAALLVLGTKSTVASNVYPSELEGAGVEGRRIRSMACHRLATLIEQNPAADAVRERIAEYASLAEELFENPPQRLALGFCCTHYGYATEFWRTAFAKRFRRVDILNPNDAMPCSGKGVSFQYHSRLPMTDGQRAAMAAVFSGRAPMIAAALSAAVPEDGLF